MAVKNCIIAFAPVAQLDRASGYGPEGREFESSPARQKYKLRLVRGLYFFVLRARFEQDGFPVRENFGLPVDDRKVRVRASAGRRVGESSPARQKYKLRLVRGLYFFVLRARFEQDGFPVRENFGLPVDDRKVRVRASALWAQMSDDRLQTTDFRADNKYQLLLPKQYILGFGACHRTALIISNNNRHIL